MQIIFQNPNDVFWLVPQRYKTDNIFWNYFAIFIHLTYFVIFQNKPFFYSIRVYVNYCKLNIHLTYGDKTCKDLPVVLLKVIVDKIMHKPNKYT